MRQRDFWALIQRMADSPSDEEAKITALVNDLTGRPPSEITGFADHLAAALHALDTPAHARAAGHPGDDAFLYLRCAVVAAGRAVYQRIRQHPEAIAEFADKDAEPLLSVAEQAYERATGMAWEHESPVSYETGANARAWGHASPPQDAGPPRSESRWAVLRYTSAIHPLPRPAYGQTFKALAAALDADPEWRRWWLGSGISRLDASLHFTGSHAEPGAQVRLGRRTAQVDLSTDDQPFTTTDRRLLRQRAIADVSALVHAVQRALDLPDPPSLPEIPDLPEDLPDSYESPFAEVPNILAAITELSRRHDRATPDMINQYLQRTGDNP